MKKIILFILIGVIMMGFFSQHKVMAATEGEIISLPSPQREGGLPLMEALNQRMSIRSYTDTKLPDQVLSNLLWAAWGYNREELKKRTAPSSMNKQEISLYLAMEDGLYLYDATEHALVCVKSEDLRKKTGAQPFVAGAALNIVYVADTKKQKSLTSSHANVGFISQNVYLLCASEGLGTVIRGWFNADKLHKVMELEEYQKIILCQTVGYPK